MTEGPSNITARVFGRPDPTAGTEPLQPWESFAMAVPHQPTAGGVGNEQTRQLPTATKEVELTGTSALLGKIKMALPKFDRPVDDLATKQDDGSAPRPTRRARLRISRVDPWSVMKTAFLFSIAFAIVGFVAVWVLWGIIAASGALDSMQEVIDSVVGNPDGSGSFQISRFVDQWRVLGLAAILSVVNVVILTALATLVAFLYNLAAGVLGGLEITLAED